MPTSMTELLLLCIIANLMVCGGAKDFPICKLFTPDESIGWLATTRRTLSVEGSGKDISCSWHFRGKQSIQPFAPPRQSLHPPRWGQRVSRGRAEISDVMGMQLWTQRVATGDPADSEKHRDFSVQGSKARALSHDFFVFFRLKVREEMVVLLKSVNLISSNIYIYICILSMYFYIDVTLGSDTF